MAKKASKKTETKTKDPKVIAQEEITRLNKEIEKAQAQLDKLKAERAATAKEAGLPEGKGTFMPPRTTSRLLVEA